MELFDFLKTDVGQGTPASSFILSLYIERSEDLHVSSAFASFFRKRTNMRLNICYTEYCWLLLRI